MFSFAAAADCESLFLFRQAANASPISLFARRRGRVTRFIMSLSRFKLDIRESRMHCEFAAAETSKLIHLAIENVERAFLHVHRRFFHGFAQSRMRMTGAGEIFRAAAKFNHRNRFGD